MWELEDNYGDKCYLSGYLINDQIIAAIISMSSLCESHEIDLSNYLIRYFKRKKIKLNKDSGLTLDLWKFIRLIKCFFSVHRINLITASPM